MAKRILGVSAYYHDSAAALVGDGEIVAAAQEERFTRKKHDAAFPRHAAAWCLGSAGLRLEDLDSIVFYDKPWVKFERMMETYLGYAPRGLGSFSTAMPIWLKEKLNLRSALKRELASLDGGRLDDLPPLLFTEHHQAHAASAFSRALFARRRALPGRCRRMGDDLGVAGRGQPADSAMGDRFPAFAGPAVFGLHLLHRLQRELGRVQSDGSGAVWRAALRRCDPGMN